MLNGMTVYEGCGSTFVVEADRQNQCNSTKGTRSKLNVGSFNMGSSCGMSSNMTVYTRCGITYLSQKDHDAANCPQKSFQSKINFDSWIYKETPENPCGTCGMFNGMTVYEGCGSTFVVEADLQNQCLSTSKLNVGSFNKGSSCGMSRNMNVYTACGTTYLSKQDLRAAKCGQKPLQSKINFDSWIYEESPEKPCGACGMFSGMTVYEGCGGAFVVKADRQNQCNSSKGTTSILNVGRFNNGSSCGMSRNMTVYTRCGITYLSKDDHDAAKCKQKTLELKINFDSWNYKKKEGKPCGSCGMVNGMTLYEGCGSTFVVQADRQEHCKPTSKLNVGSFNKGSSCGMSRNMRVYSKCGTTYLSKQDLSAAKCKHKPLESKINFDSWIYYEKEQGPIVAPP